MSAPGRRPSPEILERIRAETARQLPADEQRTVLAIPIGDDERAEALALIAWFRRRYPTPRDRLAYVRRAYRRWQTALMRAR